MPDVHLEGGNFYVFVATEYDKEDDIYFSNTEALFEHCRWWFNNRTDGFSVFQRRFER